MSDNTTQKVLSIMDLVASILFGTLKIIQARRATLKKIQAQGGDITDADWAKSDADFQTAFDKVMEEIGLSNEPAPETDPV